MKYTIITVLSIFLILPSITFANVVITEVLCNPSGSDANKEWVKIKNIGTEQIDITGWKFNDGSNHTLNIPPKNGGVGDMIIEIGEVAMLANKADQVSGVNTIIDTVMSLSNSGDTLKLIDSNGVEVHSITYGANDVIEDGNCFAYDENATSTSASSTAETVQKNIITTVNEVTKYKYRTVEIQPPQDIYIRDLPDATVLVGSIIDISPEIYDARGGVSNARCHMALGDGSQSDSCVVSHSYEFAGEYIVSINASKNSLNDSVKHHITVVDPSITIRVDDFNKYVELYNNSSDTVELNGWMISFDYKKFNIPNNTVIQANSSIKISADTMNIDIAKYSTVAKLFNSQNSLVADSNEFVNIVPKAVVNTDTELSTGIDVKSSTTTIAINSTKDIVLPVSMAKHVKIKPTPKVQKGTHVRSSSIVGMRIANNILPHTKKEFANIASNSVRSQHLVAAVANVKTGGMDNSFDTKFTWLVALLALLGVAIVPVFMKDGEVHEIVNSEQVDVSKANLTDNFTIEEIK